MIKVLLADDDVIVREGLSTILDIADEIHLVGQVSDGAQAVEAARSLQPDVILMDIRMPRVDGLTATTAICSEIPNPPKVIMLTTFGQDDYVRCALQAGAAGFLLKDCGPEVLLQAIRVVHAGEAMLAPAVTQRLIRSYTALPHLSAEQQQALHTLSPRERQVLEGIRQGKSNADIATELFMSEGTVKSHVSSIFNKLGAANRVQAALLAYTARLTE
ncbi:response regulator [Streptomyces olivoreticuli]|uniref:response regulator n=1 Tax=Streptomyces olivoreticuli TaxID=68246 RepID=UPI000E285A30|nr:response regulator transcription factor [Streptomyces olivoreticuli]